MHGGQRLVVEQRVAGEHGGAVDPRVPVEVGEPPAGFLHDHLDRGHVPRLHRRGERDLPLALGDPELLGEGLELRAELQRKSGLDARSFALVKVAALMALDAPPASYLWQVGTALDAGVTPEDLIGVLRAIAPQIGGPKVVAAAPELMVALGLSLPDGV